MQYSNNRNVFYSDNRDTRFQYCPFLVVALLTCPGLHPGNYSRGGGQNKVYESKGGNCIKRLVCVSAQHLD